VVLQNKIKRLWRVLAWKYYVWQRFFPAIRATVDPMVRYLKQDRMVSSPVRTPRNTSSTATRFTRWHSPRTRILLAFAAVSGGQRFRHTDRRRIDPHAAGSSDAPPLRRPGFLSPFPFRKPRKTNRYTVADLPNHRRSFAHRGQWKRLMGGKIRPLRPCSALRCDGVSVDGFARLAASWRRTAFNTGVCGNDPGICGLGVVGQDRLFRRRG
jgi:hypothetical protein